MQHGSICTGIPRNRPSGRVRGPWGRAAVGDRHRSRPFAVSPGARPPALRNGKQHGLGPVFFQMENWLLSTFSDLWGFFFQFISLCRFEKGRK